MIVPRPSTKRSLEAASRAYHEQLKEDDRALQYLVDERGITKEALSHFGIGIVRNPSDGHEQFLNRISFPYITPTGITTIRFRYLGDPGEKAKFLSVVGDVARLYNSTAIVSQQRIVLCEGETDTISCWMAGVPAVGVPGAKSWSPVFGRIFRNREVLVLADNDDSGAGLDFAKEVYRSLEGADIILMPKGHDVSSFTREYGTDALRSKVGL